MTYTTDVTFRAEKNKPANQPIYLYTITEYDGVNDLNLAEWDTDIFYPTGEGEIKYTKFPIKHEEIGENSQGEIDTFKVSVSNVNRTIQGYLESYNLRGKKVTITLVWADKLSNPDNNIKFIFYIDNYTATQDIVEFVLSTKYDIIDLPLPRGMFNRNYCRWKFNSDECGYTTPETTCDKRKATCRDIMHNVARFGGFPSVPTGKLFT